MPSFLSVGLFEILKIFHSTHLLIKIGSLNSDAIECQDSQRVYNDCLI